MKQRSSSGPRPFSILITNQSSSSYRRPTSLGLIGLSVIALGLLFMGIMISSTPARAFVNTYVVNSLADTNGANCGATCTLRQAINAAEASPGADIIDASNLNGTINLLTPLPLIETDITIIGPGADLLTVQRSPAPGTPNFQVFAIYRDDAAPPITVSLSKLTISNGKVISTSTFTSGGGIYAYKTNLFLSSVVITGNESWLGGGGVLNKGGNMTITDSVVSHNQAVGNLKREDGWGGGINAEGGTAIISNTVVAFNSANRGGGVYVNGDNPTDITTINNSTIVSNSATTLPPGTPPGGTVTQPSVGGGVALGNSKGKTFISNTTISYNKSYGGGGMFSEAGSPMITDTTFSYNEAITAGTGCSSRNGSGGGYFKVSHVDEPLFSATVITLTNSTFSNNKACVGGALHFNDEVVSFNNVTITQNQSKSQGGGILWAGSGNPPKIKNSVIAGNTLLVGNDGPNIRSEINSLNYNVFGPNGSFNIFNLAANDLTNTDPKLNPLQNNGGPTPTHTLKPDSPARDGISNAANCTDAYGAPLTTDARGVARPVGAGCDIGAVEAAPPALDLNGAASGLDYGATFTEALSPVAAVAKTGLTSRFDNPATVNLTITLNNLQKPLSETLAVDTSGTNVTASYNPATGVLTLNGADSAGNYQKVLRTLTYNHSGRFPATPDRSLTFALSDAFGSAPAATTSLKVLSALFVTSQSDTGGGTAFGTLSYALANVSDPLRDPAERIISFAPELSQVSLAGGSLTLPKGATLRGRCGATGPEITINGLARAVDGLTLGGNNRVEGINLSNVAPANKLLVANAGGSKGQNVVSCVRASRS